jgi:uncharacterized protein
MLLYILLGLLAGIFSGLVGVGGGIIIVPALVLFFDFTQHHAQGTTLALMVPPIGLLAAYTYYKNGYVDIRVAALICLGFFIGGFWGAKIAVYISNALLKKVFAISMIFMGIYMFFKK